MNNIDQLEIAKRLYFDNLLEVACVNLLTEEYIELMVKPIVASCECELKFSKYIEFMINENYIHEDDKELVLEKLNIDYLRNYFKTMPFMSLRFRELIFGEFRFVSLMIIKQNQIQGQPPFVYLYFSDIDMIQSEEHQMMSELKAAKNQAVSANNGKSEYLSKLSHDIRNPINVVLGMTKLCKLNIDNKLKVLEYLDKIDTSTRYLTDLINDVLDVSRIENKKITINEEKLNIKDCIEEIICIVNNSYKNQIIEKNILISHEFVLSDKIRIQQIISNLLSNACKYTLNNEPILIEIKEKYLDIFSSTYTIIVKDKGIGMSEELIDNLYTPYERGTNKDVFNIEGTGLGMVIVKNIVELMNGEITVESKLGEGTTFTVDLPIKIVEMCESNIRDLTGKRVLVAEDIEINQIIFDEYLKMSGVSCDFVTDGDMVINKYSENDYDAILMDIHMPKKDGYEATKEIRKVDKNIPIIAISADAFNEDIKKMVECGMNDHVSKPIEPDKLIKTLTKYMN